MRLGAQVCRIKNNPLQRKMGMSVMTGLILREITYFILFYFCAGQHTTLLVFRTNTYVDWGSVGGRKATALIQADTDGGEERTQH